MMLFWLVSLLCATGVESLFKPQWEPRLGAAEPNANPAVFVSEYLPDHPDTARSMSKVTGLDWPHDMYSGFITINNQTESNMFFWFFESMDGNKDAPILLWLQGGPGVSSMFGLFTEIGDSPCFALLVCAYRIAIFGDSRLVWWR